MCGIVINHPKEQPDQPWRYNRDVFLVFPPDRGEEPSVSSELDSRVSEAPDTASAVSDPSSLGNDKNPVLSTKEENKEQSDNTSLPPTTENKQPQPSNKASSDITASSDSASEETSTSTGDHPQQNLKGKKAQEPQSHKPEKQRRNKLAESAPRQKETAAPKSPPGNKIHFDLPSSAIGKKVRFAMDAFTRSDPSSNSSSSSSSSLSGSVDSLVDTTSPNVPVDRQSNERPTPKSPISKLPPNVQASLSSRHPRDSTPDRIRQVKDWKIDSPPAPAATSSNQAASPPIRPGTPFEYPPDESDDLDSELGSSIDRGSAMPPTRENLRQIHTGRNTKRNFRKLGSAPPVADSDLSSELASKVNSSKEYGAKRAWYRTPSSYEPPSASNEPDEEDKIDPLLGVTWRSV